MAKPVIFCESPNKAPHITEYSGMDCVATFGHFGDLPEKKLGVDLKTYELTFEYKERIVQAILHMARGRDVYVAGDPDREGFAISSMVAAHVQRVPHGSLRLLEIHSIDKAGIATALANSIPWEKANHNREKAFRARRAADRLIGYILSAKAREHFKQNGWSVGRLQSPALRILVDRAREIQNHKPVRFWRLFITATPGDGPAFALEHATGRFSDKATVESLLTRIQGVGTPGHVVAIEKKPARKNPPAPFTMSTLIQAADARLGFSTKETTSIAQALFEAGFITYPRGDSTRIEPEPLEAIREAIRASFGPEAVPELANVYTSPNSQADAHEAIRPTRIVPVSELSVVLEEIQKAGLSQRHAALFKLIYLRALASQMQPAKYEKTVIEAEFVGEAFKATGSVLIEAGFSRLYGEDPGSTDPEAEQSLPAVARGQELQRTGAEIKEGETKPPAYHSEGSLVRELEKKGIGRPSTYSTAVEVLKTRGYAELGTGKQKKCLLPTDKGFALIDWLLTAHPWIVSYEYTAELEAKLDQVEAGALEWKAVVREIHAKMDYADPRNIQRIATPRESLGKCPKCAGPVHECKGFFGCANWPPDKGGCDFKIWEKTLGGNISATAARDLLAGKRTRPLKLRNKAGVNYEARLELRDGRVAPVFKQ